MRFRGALLVVVCALLAGPARAEVVVDTVRVSPRVLALAGGTFALAPTPDANVLATRPLNDGRLVVVANVLPDGTVSPQEGHIVWQWQNFSRAAFQSRIGCGSSHCLVVVSRRDPMAPALEGVRVSLEGTPIDVVPLDLGPAVVDATLRIAANGDDFLVAWRHQGSDRDITGLTVVHADGTVAIHAGSLESQALGGAPALAPRGAGGFFYAWQAAAPPFMTGSYNLSHVDTTAALVETRTIDATPLTSAPVRLVVGHGRTAYLYGHNDNGIVAHARDLAGDGSDGALGDWTITALPTDQPAVLGDGYASVIAVPRAGFQDIKVQLLGADFQPAGLPVLFTTSTAANRAIVPLGTGALVVASAKTGRIDTSGTAVGDDINLFYRPAGASHGHSCSGASQSLVTWLDSRNHAGDSETLARVQYYAARVRNRDGAVLDPLGFQLPMAVYDQIASGDAFLLAHCVSHGTRDVELLISRIEPDGSILVPAGHSIETGLDDCHPHFIRSREGLLAVAYQNGGFDKKLVVVPLAADGSAAAPAIVTDAPTTTSPIEELKFSPSEVGALMGFRHPNLGQTILVPCDLAGVPPSCSPSLTLAEAYLGPVGTDLGGMLWQRASDNQSFLQMVGPDGSLLGPAVLRSFAESGSEPPGFTGGAGVSLLAWWQDFSDELRVQRLHTDGSPRDGTDTVLPSVLAKEAGFEGWSDPIQLVSLGRYHTAYTVDASEPGWDPPSIRLLRITFTDDLPPDPDAGPPDAGTPDVGDAATGLDARSPGNDAGMNMADDGGGGCGCRLGGSSSIPASASLFLAALLFLRRLSRRSARPAARGARRRNGSATRGSR